MCPRSSPRREPRPRPARGRGSPAGASSARTRPAARSPARSRPSRTLRPQATPPTTRPAADRPLAAGRGPRSSSYRRPVGSPQPCRAASRPLPTRENLRAARTASAPPLRARSRRPHHSASFRGRLSGSLAPRPALQDPHSAMHADVGTNLPVAAAAAAPSSSGSGPRARNSRRISPQRASSSTPRYMIRLGGSALLVTNAVRGCRRGRCRRWASVGASRPPRRAGCMLSARAWVH
jgi:hypothetical protein